MKQSILCGVLLSLILVYHGAAQGTALTYQGRLTENAAPANGTYSLRFTLFNAEVGGGQIGPVLTNASVPVAGGLFTTTIDFGAGVFPGSPRWLEIGVRTNGSISAHQTLGGRQPLTPTPYAIFASNAATAMSVTGTISAPVVFNNTANSFIGSHIGNGAGLSNVNALTLGGLAAADFWKTAGNSNTAAGSHFLGTTDDEPLEFKVNNMRAFRLEPNTAGVPNIIGGSSNNVVNAGVVGAFIGGGGGSVRTNRVASNFGSVLNGQDNFIHTNAILSTIAGGQENEIQSGSSQSTIAGGSQNIITNSTRAFIGMGLLNVIENATSGVIGGGTFQSIISQNSGFIGGGVLNQLGGTTHTGSSSGVSNVHNAIAGGVLNWIADGAAWGVIGGGRNNLVGNGVTGATVPGGQDNVAAGDFSFAAGRRSKATNEGTFVWADSQNADFRSTDTNQFLIRASGGVGIGTNNPASALHVQGTVTIAGGQLLAGDGSTTAPGIAFASDANTGFVHPLPNTITFVTGGNERVRVESGGNVGMGTNNPSERLHVLGNILATGTITPNSDRHAKTDVQPVDAAVILERVSKMPIQQWRFRAEAEGIRHIGPMAQDFRAAFGLGAHENAIATVDADGVALAAIQGLNQKLADALKRRDDENAELKRELAELKKMVQQLADR